MIRTLLSRLGLVAVLAGLVSGCGRTSSVSGEVKYDGNPVEKGTITFLPADGKGPPAAGPITDGRYAVKDIVPGPKVVQIVAVKDVPFARSSEEMKQRHEENKKKGNASGLIDPADVIPPNAEGNNATVEVAAGSTELNFDLKKPAPTK